MNVTVTSEIRFRRLPDDTVWADASPYEFWSRYLDEFDSVTVIGREERHREPTPSMSRVDGPSVRLRGVPPYLGPRQFIRRFFSVRRAAVPVVRDRSALILRLGSLLALVIQRELTRSGRPYGVEVVGDPWDTFAPGVVDAPLRGAIRQILTRSQRQLCAGAAGAAYVTERTLQSRYPCSRSQWAVSDVALDELAAFTTHYSSIELNGSDFVRRPHQLDASRCMRLVTVGSLAQRYKGIDLLIRAVHQLNADGRQCSLTVIGEGGYRRELEQLAADLAAPVAFVGQVTRAEVLAALDRADVFVLASRTEGLPRALLEAMARGLPCVATQVGGIPELLDHDALCECGSVESLTARLTALHTGAVDADRLAARNLERAYDFRGEVLRGRRREFYARIRAITEEWNRTELVA
jgi:glycosyltransferase involved in cell wall biosynthesis